MTKLKLSPEARKLAKANKAKLQAAALLAAKANLAENVAAVLVAPVVETAAIVAPVAGAGAPKMPTRAPVGYWVRPNAKADSFGLGLYESGAKTQTGPSRASFATRELAIQFAFLHKAGQVQFPAVVSPAAVAAVVVPAIIPA